jgi:hypothetical protein
MDIMLVSISIGKHALFLIIPCEPMWKQHVSFGGQNSLCHSQTCTVNDYVYDDRLCQYILSHGYWLPAVSMVTWLVNE